MLLPVEFEKAAFIGPVTATLVLSYAKYLAESLEERTFSVNNNAHVTLVVSSIPSRNNSSNGVRATMAEIGNAEACPATDIFALLSRVK